MDNKVICILNACTFTRTCNESCKFDFTGTYRYYSIKTIKNKIVLIIMLVCYNKRNTLHVNPNRIVVEAVCLKSPRDI